MPLPEEITLTLFNWLPRKDLLTVFSVCKDWQRISLSAKTWKEAGASSFENFKQRIEELCPELREFVFNERVSLGLAERLHKVWSLSQEQRQGLKELPNEVDEKLAKYLFSNYGLALFLEGIINKVDLEIVPEDFFKFICTKGGFIALFIEKLIAFEDIVLLDFSHLQWLFSEHGLQALREQLIPIEQLVLLTPSHLEFLLTPNGLSALREGLMTIDEVVALKPVELQLSLTDLRLAELRKVHSNQLDCDSHSYQSM
ncbi:F-box-like domain-containing protein [Legionella sp. 31fI33]|uniref:F-box-like domain-containing protein n=1 Tax=Legionella sp. 31fI33 TaxID=2886376 RepID=UPI001E4138C3|nr:F-box-like domain-containing protein [Legionella sp. 31fI33]MCC5015652.1 F-box protein [Legionella sp. 31fI33]